MNLPDAPLHWIKGQLLDLTRYSDGTFKAMLLGSPEGAESIAFDSSFEAQAFVSWWYARDSTPGRPN